MSKLILFGINLKMSIMGTKEQIEDIRRKIIMGLNKTHERLLEMKRRNNRELVVSRNGKIIKIKPASE